MSRALRCMPVAALLLAGAARAAAPAADPAAIALAERTLEAMGGREAWEATRYIAWDFLGRRRHVWDKHTGDIRVESTGEDGTTRVVLMNLDSDEGRAWDGAAEVTDAARLRTRLGAARMAWVNDAYWLVMPYKLRDPGVNLALLGRADMQDGRAADVLRLTFDDGTGLTPENRYDVFVAVDSGLVEQWSYYPTRDSAEPRLTTPWRDWRRHGRILLSGDRGEMRLTDIAVFDALPATVMRDPAPVDLAELAREHAAKSAPASPTGR